MSVDTNTGCWLLPALILGNADGYGQGKTSKDFRQGFYLPISDVLRLYFSKGVAVKMNY